jgi:uncharacterized protein YxjI
MGLGSSAPPAPNVDLYPVDGDQCCIFGPQFQVKPGKSALLHLKANIFRSGDGFKVFDKNDNDSIIFMCKGNAISPINKKVICGADEAPIFVIKEILLQLDDKLSICSCTAEGEPENEVLKLSSYSTNTIQRTSGLKNQAGNSISLTSRISLINKRGAIWLGEAEASRPAIAKIYGPLELTDELLRAQDWVRDDYFLEIAPGVDMAVILSIVLAGEAMEQASISAQANEYFTD